MFLEELKYNAFRFASKFPQVWWKALNGLTVPGGFETLDGEQIRDIMKHGRMLNPPTTGPKTPPPLEPKKHEGATVAPELPSKIATCRA